MSPIITKVDPPIPCFSIMYVYNNIIMFATLLTANVRKTRY